MTGELEPTEPMQSAAPQPTPGDELLNCLAANELVRAAAHDGELNEDTAASIGCRTTWPSDPSKADMYAVSAGCDTCRAMSLLVVRLGKIVNIEPIGEQPTIIGRCRTEAGRTILARLAAKAIEE